MRHLFTQFYLLVFGCFLVAALLMGGIYQFTEERTGNRYLEGLVQDFLDRLTQELATVPQPQWPAKIDDFSQRLHLALHTAPLDTQPLAREDIAFLQAGNIVIVEDDATFRQRIPNSNMVLIIGPVPYLSFRHEQHWLVLGFIVLLGLSLAIPILLWMRPHWRDMQQLEAAAKRLGNGELNARAALDNSSSLATLGHTFDQMAQRLQELISGRKQLTDAIAHELRTPLVRLRYRLALLEPAPSQADSAALEHDIEALEFLIEEMLTYSRLNQPELPLQLNDVELGQWARERLADWQAQGAAHQVTLSCPMAPLYWRGDVRLLARAMDNLVGNAVRHGHSEVQIRLTQDTPQWICLSVQDDGPGVATKEAQRIFEPFVRLDESRDRRTGGIGLGLAIVRSIAQLHGGEISLQPSNQGALFCLKLPVHLDTNGYQSSTDPQHPAA